MRATVVIVWCVETLAELAASEGNLDRAARLRGASDKLRQDTGHGPDPVDQARAERIEVFFAAEPDQERLAVARAEGQAMTLDEAVAYAFADD